MLACDSYQAQLVRATTRRQTGQDCGQDDVAPAARLGRDEHVPQLTPTQVKGLPSGQHAHRYEKWTIKSVVGDRDRQSRQLETGELEDKVAVRCDRRPDLTAQSRPQLVGMLGQVVLVARVNFHEERRCLRRLAGKENRRVVNLALSEESLRLGSDDLDRLDFAALQTVSQSARQLGLGEVV